MQPTASLRCFYHHHRKLSPVFPKVTCSTPHRAWSSLHGDCPTRLLSRNKPEAPYLKMDAVNNPDVSRFPSSNIQPELRDLIIDFLQDDWRALVHCVLAIPEHEPRTFRHIQRCGGLLALDWPECPNMTTFLHAFSPTTSTSWLAAAETLKITGAASLDGADGDVLLDAADFSPLPGPDVLSLAHLPCLRSLTLHACLITDVSAFVALLTGCIALEELTVNALTVEVSASALTVRELPRGKTGVLSSPAPVRRAFMLSVAKPAPPLPEAELSCGGGGGGRGRVRCPAPAAVGLRDRKRARDARARHSRHARPARRLPGR
ncbi:hypothetical protein C8Q77DRAFT_475045 [Trametes polyzona]|nr:hypothetical protein C8Q77DRAFT_475045 [Trametes polyzona]